MPTYYVSTTGLDSDSGTENKPWKTIQASVKKLIPGDTLIVNPGTYDKFDVIDGQCLSGSEASPITVKANGNVYIGRAGIAPGIQEACIYLKNVSGWVFDGFRVKDQRRAAFATHVFNSVEWIVVKNFIVENVWPVNNTTGQTTSIFRITATEADGGNLNKVWVDNNTFINCSPRDIRGKGTEIVTLFGNIQNFLVENNRFTDCVSICIDILGADYNGTFYGQPRNGVIRKNIVENNDLYRNGTNANAVGGTAAAGGTQETCNGYYNDRGGENIVWENNVHWSPKSLSSFTIGWEVGGTTLTYNLNHQIVRNNLSVSGFRAFQGGPGDASVVSKIKNIRFAHNVGISSTYSGGSGFNARHSSGTTSLKNNIWEQKKTNGIIYNRQYDDATGYDAAGSIIWCNSLNSGTLKWDNTSLTPNTYNSTIESNTALNTDPAYVSEGNYNTLVYNDATWDYKLQNGAPGYNDSEPLTTVAANGTNINIIEVNDAYWFFAGIPMPNVTGDPILINGQAANIIAVDIDNNLITIDTPLTVSIGDPITYNALILSRGLLDTVLTEEGNVIVPNSCPGLITNGDFETNNFNGWTTFTNGIVSFSAAGGAAEINITDAGSNTQLYQNNLLINSSKTYQLSFDAYASADINNFTVALLQHDSPNANVGLGREVLITTTPTTFTYNFTATLTESNTRLRFYFVASDPGIVYIDNVCLIESTEIGIIQPNFTFEPEIIYANESINFIDLSTTTNTILSWLWDFGDGGTSNLQNPMHTFVNQGTYNVELTINTIDGSESIIIPVTVLGSIVSIPPITGLYNINNIGVVAVQNNQISWFDLFNSNKNLLGVAITSYNIFTGLGQSIDPYSNKILYFNIDTGNYRLEDSEGNILNYGTDIRLSSYGALHAVHIDYISGVRGIGYWNWYQINQNLLYGNSIISWPTVFEVQYNLANSL